MLRKKTKVLNLFFPFNLKKAIDSNHDLIELRGCKMKTQFRFPKYIKQCPNRRCHLEFSNRMACIQHYRKSHAKDGVFCHLCEKPIMAPVIGMMQRHFRRKHPNHDVLQEFGERFKSTSTSTSMGKKQTPKKVYKCSFYSN